MTHWFRSTIRHGVCPAALLAAVLAGCAVPRAVAPPAAPPGAASTPTSKPSRSTRPAPAVLQTSDFVAVVVRPGETLAALAATWLHDADRAWEIAEYNEVAEAIPGQELAIPLRPFRRGGLSADGYQTVPVLVYHKFAERSTDRMTVSREAFEAQMLTLREKGYRVISLDQLYEFLALRGQLPPRSVVITIDDGWRTSYDIAFPILKRYGYPATIFVYTQLVAVGAKTISWDQLREMAAHGVSVQCHTVSHRNLALPLEQENAEQYLAAIQREIVDATRTIEQKIGARPTFFAYPYGETNGLTISLLKKQGYRGAFTVVREANPFFQQDFRLNRSMVFGDTDLARFERNLAVSDRRALR